MWSGANADDTNFENHCCTYFYRMDFDGDLKLTYDDFVYMFIKVIITDKTLKINGTAFTLQQMQALFQQAAKFLPLTDESLLQVILTGGLTLDDFLASMTARRYTQKLAGQINDTVAFLHQVFSSEGGAMDLTMYDDTILCMVFGLDPANVPIGFKALDLNGDGKVTAAEGIDSAMKYFNEAPLGDRSNAWAGPILTCDSVSKKNPSTVPPATTTTSA